MTATDTPASRIDTLRARASQARAAGRAVHGHPLRDQAAPHAALGVLVLAGTALHAAASTSPDRAEILAGTAATCIVISVVAATFTRRRVADKQMRRRAMVAYAVVCGWLPFVATVGVSTDTVFPLVAVGFALAAHWWHKKRIPNTATVVTPIVVDTPRPDQFVHLWKTNIASSGGNLTGTSLESPEPIEAGARYVLRLVPGRMNIETVRGQLENLRTGLRLQPSDDLIVERHPLLDASCLLLTIVTKSPVKDSVMWPGPSAFDPATGTIALGPHVDGEGVARWRLYTSNSMWGGYLTGSSGSGKSRMIESIGMSAAASETHPTIVWFIDGDNGASSPLLAKHADHKGLDEEMLQAGEILAGALLLMRLRRAENVAYELEGFQPQEGREGVLIIIDECHIIFADDDLRAMCAEIARRGRKVGVTILAASQVATLDAFGGQGASHGDALRSSLRAGNGVILKSLTNNTKDVFKVDIDPTQFPDLPGYAYYVAGKGSADRTAPFRGYYVTDAQRATWPQKIMWRELSEGEANAYGPEYVRRRDLAEEAKADSLEWIEAVKSGRFRPTAAGNAKKPAVAGGDGAAAPFGVSAFPVWDPSDPGKFAPEPALVPKVKEPHDGHWKVLAAMEAGSTSPKAIQDATGYSERQVYNLLPELIDMGRVRKDGRTYQLTAFGQAAA